MVTTAFCGKPAVMTDFSINAPVGQASTQAPQDTHSDSRNGCCCEAETRESMPRPSMVSANVPCVSSQARTQREQTMHRSLSKRKYGLLASTAFGVWRSRAVAAPAKRDAPMPCAAARVSSSQRLLSGQLPMGCSETYNSSTLRRSLFTASLAVRTFMPAATSVVQEAGKPLRPSISTRHTRQEPKAFSVSVAQSFGMSPPAIAAARMMDVPAGTVTGTPSISSVTGSPLAAGVPLSW